MPGLARRSGQGGSPFRFVPSCIERRSPNHHQPERLSNAEPNRAGVCVLRQFIGAATLPIVEPGERHWDIFKRLCIETETRGPRVADAWFAALAIEWGCEWITFDRDFARFPGLKWGVPATM